MNLLDANNNLKSFATSQHIVANHGLIMPQQMHKNDIVSLSRKNAVLKPCLDASLEMFRKKNIRTVDVSVSGDDGRKLGESNADDTTEIDFFSEFTPTDVLFGRGGLANCHEGNKRFRQMVSKYRSEYRRVIKVKKPAVARRVVAEIKDSNPPGRFLKREENSGRWYAVSDQSATEKTSQALREKSSKEKKVTGRFMKRDEETGKWFIVDDEANKPSGNEQSLKKENLVTLPKTDLSNCTQEKKLHLNHDGHFQNDKTSVKAIRNHSNLEADFKVGKTSIKHTKICVASNEENLKSSVNIGLKNIVPTSISAAQPLIDLVSALPKISPSNSNSNTSTGNYPLLPTRGNRTMLHNNLYANLALHYPQQTSIAEKVALAFELEKLNRDKLDKSTREVCAPKERLSSRIDSGSSPFSVVKEVMESYNTSSKRRKIKASNTTSDPHTDTKSNEALFQPEKHKMSQKQGSTESKVMQENTETCDITSQMENTEDPFVEILVHDYVSEVTETDVLFGRGGLTNCHEGNRKFRELVNIYRPLYTRAIKVKKPSVARLVVAEIKRSNPPGRFLKHDEKSQRWYLVSDRNAEEKASQACREKCPKERKMKRNVESGEWFTVDDPAETLSKNEDKVSEVNTLKVDSSCNPEVASGHNDRATKDKKRKSDELKSSGCAVSPDETVDRSTVNVPILEKIAAALKRNLSPTTPPYGFNLNANSINGSYSSSPGFRDSVIQSNLLHGKLASLNVPHFTGPDEVALTIKATEMRRNTIKNAMNTIRSAEAIQRNFTSTFTDKPAVLNNITFNSLLSIDALRRSPFIPAVTNLEIQNNLENALKNARNSARNSAATRQDSLNSTAALNDMQMYGAERWNSFNSAVTERSKMQTNIRSLEAARRRLETTTDSEMRYNIEQAIHEMARQGSHTDAEKDQISCGSMEEYEKCDNHGAPSKESITEKEVIYISGNDILCGRGGKTNNHPGNIHFRDLVNRHRSDYIAAPKVKKPDVARLIVKSVRLGTPPGRFLKKYAKNGKWYEISERKAAEKASQALREK